MTLSQYLHSDSNSNSDDTLMEVLQQVSSLIDSNDEEQVDLFSKIHLSPEAPDAPLKLIKLLTLIISKRMKHPLFMNESNSTVNRLVSYVQSFVSLLQALSHNKDLATLFLIGENGSQSFSDLQKTTLLEQAARARSFISSIESEHLDTILLNHEKYLKDIESLPEKMKELNHLKKQIEKTDQIEMLRSYSKTIASILETALIFNDILLKKQGKETVFSLTKTESKSHQSSSKQYKKIIKKLKNEIESLNEECAEKNAQISAFQKEIRDFRKESDSLLSKMKKSSHAKEKVTLQFESLQAQKDQLTEDLNSLKSRLLCENQTSEMIFQLKEKLKKVENENRKMRELLEEAAQNQEKINNQWSCGANDLKNDLHSKQYENNLLKQQISQLMEQINNYQKNNDQKQQKIECLTDKNNSLNSQINDLSKTNSRLQTRINDLENLYKDATNQLESSEKSKSDLLNQITKLKKEIKTKLNENDELKAMLDRTTLDARKQMDDNAILIKQLRRVDTEKTSSNQKDDEIQKLKEKLKSAFMFIKKLQKQISEYKNRMKKDKCDFEHFSSDNFYNDFDSCSNNQKTYYCEVHEGSPFNYNALDSKLNDLNHTIHQLEKTVHKSRAQNCLSSSSDC